LRRIVSAVEGVRTLNAVFRNVNSSGGEK
jgi:hypothetical protein